MVLISNRVIYVFLLLLRLVCTLLPGYIHPDEFFQGGQELFFGCSGCSGETARSGSSSNCPPQKLLLQEQQHDGDGDNNDGAYVSIQGKFYNLTTTWEFEPNNAIRSIMPPTLMTLIPLRVYSWVKTIVVSTAYYYVTINDGHQRADSTSTSTGAWNDRLNGLEILVIPRLFLFLLSIVTIDISIWYIAYISHRSKSSKKISFIDAVWYLPVPDESIVFASSWPALVFLVRPFSNTLETICVSLILLVSAYQTQTQSQPSKIKDNENAAEQTSIGMLLLAGLLCSIGIFTRFTFGIFAFPAVLAIIHRAGCDALTTRQKTRIPDDDSVLAPSYRTIANAPCYLTSVLRTTIWIGIAFVFGVLALVRVDSHFYHSQGGGGESSDDRMPYVLSPWNALVYNSRVGNLSEHGLHPRITHCLVNMPMLYGPLAIFFYGSTVRDVWDKLVTHTTAAWKRDTTVMPPFEPTSQVVTTPTLYPTCRGIVWMGLGVLSCAPHQEARFLLPLVVPLSLLHGRAILRARRRRTMIIFWMLFNLVLMIFFGVLHQGSVAPSLLALPEYHAIPSTTTMRSNSTLKAIISYHTYMPPTFLLREGSGASFGVKGTLSNNEELNTCLSDVGSCKALKTSSELEQAERQSNMHNVVPIIDLKGSSLPSLMNELDVILMCSPQTSEGSHVESTYVYLISPPRALNIKSCNEDFTEDFLCPFSEKYLCEEVWYSTQISTEDMPQWCGNLKHFLSSMKLSTFKVRCS